MGKYFSLTGIIFLININFSMGAEAGMPQLNPEYWFAQIFWLVFIFGALYLAIWRLILPRITDSIENRKKHIINDLDEAQKLKERAEKKLIEYKKIIDDSKNEAKKIILENKMKLSKDIEEKRKKFESEIEKELTEAEKQVKKFHQSSTTNINKIAVEISSEVMKNTLKYQVNISNISAIVDEISKNKTKKYL